MLCSHIPVLKRGKSLRTYSQNACLGQAAPRCYPNHWALCIPGRLAVKHKQLTRCSSFLVLLPRVSLPLQLKPVPEPLPVPPSTAAGASGRGAGGGVAPFPLPLPGGVARLPRAVPLEDTHRSLEPVARGAREVNAAKANVKRVFVLPQQAVRPMRVPRASCSIWCCHNVCDVVLCGITTT